MARKNTPRTSTARSSLTPLSTMNTLPASTRASVVELLTARLADAIDARQQVKHAHWNLRGPSFIALHELFDEVVGNLDEGIDEMAERIAQLGGIAPGTVASVASTTSLRPYPSGLVADLDHAKAVGSVLASLGGNIREAIDTADDAGDAATADLFTAFSRDLDKDLWKVESHLHGR